MNVKNTTPTTPTTPQNDTTKVEHNACGHPARADDSPSQNARLAGSGAPLGYASPDWSVVIFSSESTNS
jgi:hypothetical protein